MKRGTKRDKYVNIHVQNVLQKMFPNNVLNEDILPPLQSLQIYVQIYSCRSGVNH